MKSQWDALLLVKTTAGAASYNQCMEQLCCFAAIKQDMLQKQDRRQDLRILKGYQDWLTATQQPAKFSWCSVWMMNDYNRSC